MSGAKRIHIQKTVELADFAEKNVKRIHILKEREFECCLFVRPSELKPLQYNVFLLCQSQSQEKRICEFPLFSRMFLNAFSFTKQSSLRSFGSLATSGAEGFRSLGSLPFSEEPKRIRPLFSSCSSIQSKI